MCNCDYKHIPLLAPTKDLLSDWRDKKIDWSEYVDRFSELMNTRKIENLITLDELDEACLLCAEPTSENCHRRLIAEYLQEKFDNIEIVHL